MYPYFEPANIVMVYMLGSTIAGVRFGRGPAVVAAVANVFAFDFCFVPPRFTFSVADVQYIVTFAVMLVVTLVIANLMASVRQQTRVAGARERRTALLYAMSRELAATRGIDSMARVAVQARRRSVRLQGSRAAAGRAGRVALPARGARGGSFVARICRLRNGSSITASVPGLGSDTLPAAPALYVPLGESGSGFGVLAVLPENRRRVLLPEQRHLLETFAGQIGLAMERARLAEQAEASRVCGRDRKLAQHVAGFDLARLAHAACSHCRCQQHARRARGRISTRRARTSSLVRSRPRPATCPSWSPTCWT